MPCQSLLTSISSRMPSSKSLSLSVAILQHFTADTLHYAVTSTFDLEHLWYTGYTAVKLCAKFERNRAICSGVIAI